MFKKIILTLITVLSIKSYSLEFLYSDFLFERLNIQSKSNICYIGPVDENLAAKLLAKVAEEQIDTDDLEPNDYDAAILISLRGEEDIALMAQSLKAQGRGLIIAPLPDSSEFGILSEMAQNPDWKEKIGFESLLPFQAYGPLMRKYHLTDLSHYIMRDLLQFEDIAALKKWVSQEIAPSLGQENLQFVDAYVDCARRSGLLQMRNDGAIRLVLRHLVMVVCKDREKFFDENRIFLPM